MKLIHDEMSVPREAKVFIAAMTVEAYRKLVDGHRGFGGALYKEGADGTRWLVLAHDGMQPRFKTLADAGNAVLLWGVNPYAEVEGLVRKYVLGPDLQADLNPEWESAEALVCTVYREEKRLPEAERPIEDGFERSGLLWVNKG